MSEEELKKPSELGAWLQKTFLSRSEVYTSVFGPDRIEKRFNIDDEICFEAWETGEYWLTAREPLGVVLISHVPFHLIEGETYHAKSLKQWEVYEENTYD